MVGDGEQEGAGGGAGDAERHDRFAAERVGGRAEEEAAAQALSYTPSAVSQQLKQLSRELGVALLVPDGRQVRLTSAARTLLGHADALFTEWERTLAELAADVEEPSGRLSCAGSPRRLRRSCLPQ